MIENMKFEIKGEKIILRSLKKADADSLCLAANDRQVFRHISGVPYPYTLKDAEEYILYVQKRLNEQSSYELGITLKGEKEVIGMIGLKNADRDDKFSAEIGFWLGKKYWRQRIGSEAIRLMLDFAFNDINLHKVSAEVMESNEISLRLLEKIGFKKEGLLRESEKRAGKWMNVYYLGLLKKEFKNK